MKQSFLIAEDESWIKCLVCGFTSYNKIDVVHRYCGNCCAFHNGAPTVCDFCTGEYPLVHDYKAGRQIAGPLPDGRLYVDKDLLWAACAECHRLIGEQNWEVLLDRAVDGAEARYGKIPDRKASRRVIKFCWETALGKDFMEPPTKAKTAKI